MGIFRKYVSESWDVIRNDPSQKNSLWFDDPKVEHDEKRRIEKDLQMGSFGEIYHTGVPDISSYGGEKGLNDFRWRYW